MKYILSFTLCIFSLFCFAQGTYITAKVAGSGRLLAFWNDKNLKKNEKGEVVRGTPIANNMLKPQGNNLNIAFEKGGVLEFNSKGEVIKGTLGATYNLTTTTGMVKSFDEGTEVVFNAKGQVPLETQSTKEKYGDVCSFSTKAYTDVRLYCKSAIHNEMNANYISGGMVAKANVEFFPCGFAGIKAKKNSTIEFFSSEYGPWIIKDEEHREPQVKLNNCVSGTVQKMTIDGSYSLYMYGSGYSIEFPDGTEIEFEPALMRPAIYLNIFNWVVTAKLGQDANIPTLGLVKKGKTIRGHYSTKDGAQPSQGYLTVEDN